MYTFLCHGYSKHLLLVWLVVCAPIMRLHYFLFRNGKLFSHRRCNSDEENPISVFDFVGDVKHNQLAKAMGALAAMLMEPSGRAGRQHLRLLHLILGDVNGQDVRNKHCKRHCS